MIQKNNSRFKEITKISMQILDKNSLHSQFDVHKNRLFKLSQNYNKNKQEELFTL